jgi:hypothetical protein
MTTDNFCFYFQNRLIQTGQTGDQWYSDTSPPLVFPGCGVGNEKEQAFAVLFTLSATPNL